MNAVIAKYFNNLTEEQIRQFDALDELYRYWNERINVISRKDMDNLYTHHILHSLAIARIHSFESGSVVMDVGCGGGFPGIPLAIMFPEVQFKLVDSIGKKIKVVENVAEGLGLKNVEAFHARVESLDFKVDYVVSRAVTDLKPFLGWCWKKIKGGGFNGVLYLKGGDLAEEITEGTKGVKGICKKTVFNIKNYFDEEYFETKRVLYIRKG
ncbi:MAG: 16S rRNA (guanine(527)-N(7))-methyltransferase RsmG [Rikenellaceae bacterium]